LLCFLHGLILHLNVLQSVISYTPSKFSTQKWVWLKGTWFGVYIEQLTVIVHQTSHHPSLVLSNISSIALYCSEIWTNC